MAIGRFMSVDPLAEKYPYNSTYAFQENKMGMGKELEGLELAPFPWLEVALGSSDVIKLSTEIGGKTTEVGGKFSEIDFVAEEHHVIPQATKGNQVVQDAIAEGFKFEGAENKITLEKFSRATGNGRHGNHPSYNKGVLEKLGQFGKASEGAKAGEASKTPLQFLRNLTQELKETIKNNPDKKVNDLFKSELAPVKRDNTSVKKPELPKPAPKPKPKPGEIWS